MSFLLPSPNMVNVDVKLLVDFPAIFSDFLLFVIYVCLRYSYVSISFMQYSLRCPREIKNEH